MQKLVQEVIAQSEPTFPYDGPFEEPDQPPTAGEAIIRLSTSASSLEIGSTATTDLRLESNNEQVESYTIVITFNASVLEVVDANLSQTGVQVNFVDDFSQVQTNSANNTTGVIQISAFASGTPQSINRNIAQITFRAKTSGTSVVSVNRSESQVVNDEDSDVLASSTSLNFTVTGETQTGQPSDDGDGGDGTQPLPASGLFDTLATFGSVLSGLLMLYVGIKTVIDKKRGKEIEI